jgi:hypothetical protein
VGTIAHFDIAALVAAHGVLHFVETGTGRGESLAHASRFTFRSLSSCEIEPSLAAAAIAGFAPDTRVKVFQASSVEFLAMVCTLTPKDEPILFWLDAHFPGGDYGIRSYAATRSEADRLPLAKELAIIAESRPEGRDVVVCDDLRIWLDGPFQHGGLPADLRPLCPKRRDARVFAETFGGTHAIAFDYAHEGYVVLTPKEVGPPTLLGADSLATLLALARGSPKGDFVEIGVYKGGVAWHLERLAVKRCSRVHLFDTFAGIPEKGDEDEAHEVGDFSDTSFAAVQQAVPSARFYPGVFPSTMPDFWTPGDLAFVHVDCDQYRATAAAIVHFVPLLAEGGVMLFDDYGAIAGATKAVDEFFRADEIKRTPQGKAYFVKGAIDA